MSRSSNNIIFNLVKAEHRWKAHLLSMWDGIVADLADKVTIERISDDTLVIGVTHPCWAQELMMSSNHLKFKINRALDGKKILKIRFVNSTSSSNTVNKRISENKEIESINSIGEEKTNQLSLLSVGGEWHHVNLTSDEEARLELINSKELRAMLRTFYLACKRRGSVDDESTKNESYSLTDTYFDGRI
jgi:hypothetical protein